MSTKTAMMAYRRSSDGRGLLSARNISIKLVFPLFSTVGGGSRTAGLTKIVLEVE